MIPCRGFIPPEYIDKQEISPKFDVFSVGVIIVQMMAGRKNYFDCGSVPSEIFNELVSQNVPIPEYSSSPKIMVCIILATYKYDICVDFAGM